MRSTSTRISAAVRRTLGALVTLAALAVFALAAPAAAHAAPGAHVAVNANARTCTKLGQCLVGTVANDGSGPNYQVSDMSCWWDGDTYNGSPRWFQVYVTLNGNLGTNWLFVHSSFVTNQPSVGRCNSGGH